MGKLGVAPGESIVLALCLSFDMDHLTQKEHDDSQEGRSFAQDVALGAAEACCVCPGRSVGHRRTEGLFVVLWDDPIHRSFNKFVQCTSNEWDTFHFRLPKRVH